MGKTIFGVDTTKKITPIAVRNAIIRCFISAHENVLNEMKTFSDFGSEEKFDQMKKINVEFLIKSIFDEIGANYDKPKKSDLIKVCNSLADYAKHFRDSKTIKKNYKAIEELIKKIK